MEHKCDLPTGMQIRYDAGRWKMYDTVLLRGINYCPYCSEKLEGREEEMRMERARHECEENDRGRPIEYWEATKHWYLEATGNWVVYHCPYCGEKLEPPNVKIEVSQKILKAWHDDLQKVLVEVEGSYGSDAPLRVKRAIKGIQSALGYD